VLVACQLVSDEHYHSLMHACMRVCCTAATVLWSFPHQWLPKSQIPILSAAFLDSRPSLHRPTQLTNPVSTCNPTTYSCLKSRAALLQQPPSSLQMWCYSRSRLAQGTTARSPLHPLSSCHLPSRSNARQSELFQGSTLCGKATCLGLCATAMLPFRRSHSATLGSLSSRPR